MSGLSSYAAVLVAAAVLVGLGVYIGRELVRPERRAWEGTDSVPPLPHPWPGEPSCVLLQQQLVCQLYVPQTLCSPLSYAPSQAGVPGFDVSREPRHITEMRSVQTALRSNKQRPGYSTFACTGHKWEDDYLYHSCRLPNVDSV